MLIKDMGDLERLTERVAELEKTLYYERDRDRQARTDLLNWQAKAKNLEDELLKVQAQSMECAAVLVERSEGMPVREIANCVRGLKTEKIRWQGQVDLTMEMIQRAYATLQSQQEVSKDG